MYRGCALLAAAAVARIPIPAFGVHDGGGDGYTGMFVGYDPSTGNDKFYGAGAGGYFVYDISDVAKPRLLTSIVGAAGVLRGSAIIPTPDARYAVTATGYQYSPLRIFDLTEGLRGIEQTVSRPIGAWMADWHDAVRSADVRWPLAFVSSYEDGLQIFNMVDPKNPVTVGWYYTCLCAHQTGFGSSAAPQGESTVNGAVGVDVRNRDGMIAVADANSGLWLLRLDGFGGWRGEDWGVPNVSSVQDWSRGAVAKLQREFNSTREMLLSQRQQRQQRLDSGQMPDFLEETRSIRDSDWQAATFLCSMRLGL